MEAETGEAAQTKQAGNTSSQLSVWSVFGLIQITSVIFILMQALLKDAQEVSDITVSEISFIRTVFALIASIVVLCFTRENPFRVRRDLMAPLALRSFMGSAASITIVKSVEQVPLTVFQVVTKSDAFLTGLLACIWLGERLSYF